MRITTTAHAMALGLYAMMAIIGATWAVGAASMTNAIRMYGDWAPAVIGLVIAFAGIIGGLSALLSHLFRRPAGALLTEAVCAGLCGLGFATYWVSIFGKAATTELITAGLVLICLARVAQIGVELHRIRHASR